MMYWKLAIQNIRRSLRDYIIYFVTLTLTAALMYSFFALGFSSDVLAMAENMSMLTTGILLMSALVAFMSSFVIGYAIRFMLGRRKKEFATYELIGMEARTVRNLFLAENSIIGTGAFLLGSLVGTGLSGLRRQKIGDNLIVVAPKQIGKNSNTSNYRRQNRKSKPEIHLPTSSFLAFFTLHS